MESHGDCRTTEGTDLRSGNSSASSHLRYAKAVIIGPLRANQTDVSLKVPFAAFYGALPSAPAANASVAAADRAVLYASVAVFLAANN